MEKYKITYYLYPEKNIEITVMANTYKDAVIFAKGYRKDSFSVVKVEG